MIRSESYSWRKSIPFLCFSVMAAYTHYFALVSVGIAYVFLLVDVLKKQRQFSELKKVVILIIIAILCYLPWIFVLLQQIASVTTSYWIQKITAETVWGYALFVFDNVFCLVIFIYVVSRTLYKKKVDEHRKFVLLGSISCTIGTVLVGILASILIRPVFVERYMVPSLGCLWFAFCLALSAIRDNEYKYAIVLLAFVFCLNHISNFVVNEDQAKTESERLMTEVSEDNVLYVFENARARNVMAAMTGEMCYQFKDNIDELSIAVYGNIGTINTVEEIQMFIENGMSAYWVETVDENSLMPENEMEACGLQYKEIGEFYIENTIAKQHLIIYKLE